MWPSRSLGSLYSRIYCKHENSVFTLSEVIGLVGSRAKAKLYIHRLRSMGWVFPFPPMGRGAYRLQRPEVCVLTHCSKIRGLIGLKHPEYALLLGNYATEIIKSIPYIRSLVVFGSIARGKARRNSDIDLLAIIDGEENLRSAFNLMIRIENEGQTEDELKYLATYGMDTHISILPMSSNRLATHPFILLDIVADGITIYDDRTFRLEAKRMKSRLKELGAVRVFLDKEDWYWDLNPSYSRRAVIEI
jgi:predicted nucleotidyltransferase